MANKRWFSLFCLSAAASCLAAVLGGAPAHAATPVFVDGVGNCAGRTPCFTTIQAGINNAGPAPAVVNVFPGTYAENVDLSLMGSAIAGSPGDLTLRTVNGSGVPTPGTASILPAAGIPLDNSVSPFPGDLSIEGFTVQSANDQGMSLNIAGDLKLIGIVSDANGTDGASLTVQGGNVTITDSSFSGNTNGFGISLGVAENLTFERVTVDNNDNFNASLSVTGEVRIIDSSFSNSVTNSGLSFGTATNVILERLVVDNNFNFNASISLTGTIRISDSSFSNSTDNSGLSFGTATDVILERLAVNNNNNFNASISLTGAIRISDSSFSNSTENSGLSFGTATDVVLERLAVNNNDNFNASISLTGAIRISDSSFSNSTDNSGLSFSTATDATLERVVVNGNDNFNASIGASGSVHITGSSFNESTSSNGLFVRGENVLITASRFIGNQSGGVQLTPLEATGDLQLRCNDIADNEESGLFVADTAAVNAEYNYWGAPSGPTHPTNPNGTGDEIADAANGGSGTVDFKPFLATPAAESPVCKQAAPALDAFPLAVLLLALLVLPARRLARRSAA